MTDKTEVYSAIGQRIRSASGPPEILGILRELAALTDSGDLSEKDGYELQVPAFDALRNLTLETPDDAKDLLLECLLPLCLGTSSDAAGELYQLRQCLVDWLNQYSEETLREELRDAVLERVYPRLGSQDPRPACWVISGIGYRANEAVDLLWGLAAQRDDETGDVALAALVHLGVEPGHRQRMLSELHRRATTRYSRSFVSALTTMADTTSIPVVYDAWLHSDHLVSDAFERSLVFNVLRAALDSASGDAAVQDATWQMLVELVRERPDDFSHEFYLGHTAPACNSSLVVPTMIDWLAQFPKDDRKPSWGHYLIGLRLEECTRPRQLQGWADFGDAQALEPLRADACLDTGNDGFWTTTEASVKKKAWETLLRAGFANALQWFDEAVLSETSRFVQHSVIEWLSLFRFESLPEAILDWITEDVVHARGEKDSRDFMLRMAATRMARSSASREAFEGLLHFGFTSEGKAMMPSVLALAEVAVFLVAEGDTSVVEDLVDAAMNGEAAHQRVAAAYAIEHIASSSPSFLLGDADKLVSIACDTERDAVERGTILNALSHLKGWHIPDELLRQMQAWACEPDRWVGGGSLHALARHGHLRDDPQLLSGVLGLRHVAGKWDVAEESQRFEWAPYTVGLLYHHNPLRFEPAIASLIRTLEWGPVSQILGWLQRTHGAPHYTELPHMVKASLAQRARERQLSYSGETETLRVLGRLAPEELVKGDWSEKWPNWLPDSRVALADALRDATRRSGLRAAALRQLTRLAGDGHFAVRRAAFRAIGGQSMDALHGLCSSWSDASSVDLRRRAAEGYGWLGSERNDHDPHLIEELYWRLATDPEPLVRDAARRTWDDRRKRLWAHQYLSPVRRVKGRVNQEILDAWRYGEALVRLGDDSCVVALRDHLNKNWDSLAPNVRYWIQQVIKGLEEHWRKVTSEWPEPWFAWEGAIQEGSAKVYTRSKKAIDVNYSIWMQPRAAPSEPPVAEWGGAIWPIPFALLHRGEVTIEVEGGQRGKILLTRTSGETAVFLGSGPCPL